jgi:cytochrome P450
VPEPAPDAGLVVAGQVSRATALRAAVDTLLRHPQAEPSRLV